MKKLIYLFLFVSFTSFSQDYNDSGIEKAKNGDYY